MKKTIRFIINPVSGVGKQKGIEEKIKANLNHDIFDCEVSYTKAAKHATELAREGAEKNMDFVIAVGGDGTVNEVAKGLIHSETAMGIIPMGSGNGLALHLNIPVDPIKAIQLINTCHVRKMDTCTANGVPFLNVSGIGFDSHIAHKFAEAGTRGISTYLRLVVSEWWNYNNKKYILEYDNKKIETDAIMISFANGTQFGNNFLISPESVDNDGLLDICILKKFPALKIPSVLYHALNRQMHEFPHMEIISSASIRITQEDDHVHIDGEPTKLGKEIQLEVLPLSLKVISNTLI